MEENKNILSALGSLGQLQDVESLWFNTKKFSIDGYKFINCRFDNCELTVLSSRFEFINCYIDDKTQILYGADPLKIVRLWNSRNTSLIGVTAIYGPDRNPDGTVSIKGF